RLGTDAGKGRLIGIQPYLTSYSYSTVYNLETTLRFYFDQLRREDMLPPDAVVVLPEYTGTWLVTTNEKTNLYQAADLQTAMRTLIASNLPAFAWHWWKAPAPDPMQYALFSLKAKRMARQYQSLFSRLARDYRCTIVAGSIVLPDAWLDTAGDLRIRSGSPLYNTTAVFGPEGCILPPLVKKMYPTAEEQAFTAAAPPGAAPVFRTPAGRMGVLICADSWYPDAYLRLQQQADFVVVPSLAGTDSVWMAPWKGYSGFAAPADVDPTDPGRIPEGVAWEKYSMGTRAPRSNIHQGLNVFFTGNLWELRPEGRALVLQIDSLQELPPALARGRIITVYLN
ncbi:MAG TPA: carbon-nitrogen hydrolase family protein, partial [Lacibacter sp.]|nr:carbon-nitrogen hydrolase family protein [Lacibacter sp.]